jgi:tetratricopeptide (TPR) repeat protein
VGADGRMPFPLIGEVQAAGLRPTELEARMRQRLAKEIPGARTIVARESKEAIRLDARALPAVAQLLTGPAVEADLLWHALPRDPATLVDLSRVLEARGRLVTAATALEDAVAIAATPRQKASVTTARMLGQGDAGLQRTVTQVLARMGLLREAIGVAQHAMRLDPRADDLRVDLGDLYSKMGMPDQAKAQYQTVLARQPAHEAAARGLASLRNPG